MGTDKERLNRLMAEQCDGIVTGLYEYWRCYKLCFPAKTIFIPFPIIVGEAPVIADETPEKLNLFIGISKNRSAYKGTDIMLRAAEAVKQQYPDRLDLTVASGLPFAEYVRTMLGSDAIMDQLYSYTPSMNSEQLAHGIICIGGGEPENYEILHETTLRPIINVLPTYESCVAELTRLVTHLDLIPRCAVRATPMSANTTTTSRWPSSTKPFTGRCSRASYALSFQFLLIAAIDPIKQQYVKTNLPQSGYDRYRTVVSSLLTVYLRLQDAI